VGNLTQWLTDSDCPEEVSPPEFAPSSLVSVLKETKLPIGKRGCVIEPNQRARERERERERQRRLSLCLSLVWLDYTHGRKEGRKEDYASVARHIAHSPLAVIVVARNNETWWAGV